MLALLHQILLRRLINNALPNLKYLPLPKAVIMCSGNKFDTLKANSQFRNERFCILRGRAIELHYFSPDPREPYFCEKFGSLDEFFSTHLIDHACRANGAEVVFLPEIMRASIARTDKSLSSEDHTNKTITWLNLTEQRKQQQRDYYNRLVQDYMSTLTYKLARLVLAL